ncbi:hypothetical protein HG530_003066 [Fusarium avenaceum]|nr:hypothetical protein HG530_003066 [Fusarium avenaceum]
MSASVTVVPSATSRQAYLIHQALVALIRLSLNSDKDVLNVFDNLVADRLIKEGCGKHLKDKSGTALVILENGLQNLVVRSKKQRLEDSVTGIRLCLLVDDLKHSEISNLVGAEMNQEKRNGVRANVFNDQRHLSRGLADVNDLLGRPSAVLVHTNLGHMRCNFRQHGIAKLVRAVLKQLLHHSVTEIVGRKLGNLRKHVNSNILDLSLRQALIINSLADVPKLWCIVDTSSRSLGSRICGRSARSCLASRCGDIGSLSAILTLGKWIGARRWENAIMTRSVGSRGRLGKVDTNRTGSWENLLAVHTGLGRDGAFDPLKVNKATVLVKCAGRSLKALLVSAEKASIAAVGSAKVDTSNSLRKILVILVVLQSNFGSGDIVRQIGVARHVGSHQTTSRGVQDTSGSSTRTVGRCLVGKSLDGQIMIVDSSVGSGQLILKSCHVLGVQGHLGIIIIVVIGVFVLIVDRVGSESAGLLGKVEIGQVRSSELCTRRLRRLCQTKIIQSPHMNIRLTASFLGELRLGGRAGAVRANAGNAGQGRSSLTSPTCRVPAAED